MMIDEAAEVRDATIMRAIEEYERAKAAIEDRIASGRDVVYRGVVVDFFFTAWYDGGKANDDGSLSPAPDDDVFIGGWQGVGPKLGDAKAIDDVIDAMYAERDLIAPPIPEEKPWAKCMQFRFRYRN